MRKISMKDFPTKMSAPKFKKGDRVSIIKDLKCFYNMEYDPYKDSFTVQDVNIYNLGGKVAWVYAIKSDKTYDRSDYWGGIATNYMCYNVTEDSIELHPIYNSKLGQLL